MRFSSLRRAVAPWLAAAVLAAGAGCADDPFDPGGGADARLNVSVLLNSAAVTALVVEVTGDGIPTPLLFNLAVSAGVASGTITVPAGGERTITMRAYDGNGVETHRGVRTIAVVEGNNPPVTLTLNPLAGSVPITATLGSIFISLDPNGGGIYVGDTLRLAVTVVDGNGVEIAGTPGFAVAHPTIASISPGGTVTGLRPGNTTVVATFGGFAAAAGLAVVEGYSDVAYSTFRNDVSLTPFDLQGVFRVSATDVWATGTSGGVYHYDGSSWTQQNLGSAGTGLGLLYSVWSDGPSNVWVVGNQGAVLHFNGATWTRMANPVNATSASLLAVWGRSASDIWVAGTGGILMRWNGSAWSTMSLGFSGVVSGIWGLPTDTVYVSGYTGKVWRWDGASITQFGPGSGSLRAIHGRASNDIKVVGIGGEIYGWNGSGWTSEPSGVTTALYSVLGTPGGTWYAVGASGRIRTSTGNGTWTNASIAGIASLFGGVSGTDGDVYVVGGRGTILRNTGAWSVVHRSGPGLWSLYVAARDRVFASGYENSILMFDGASWTQAPLPASPAILYGISGTSAQHVVAVGTSSTAWYFDGTSWTSESPGVTTLYNVHVAPSGSAYAVGPGGNVLRRGPNGGWSTVHVAGGLPLYGVHAVNDNDVYAVGENGRILHWDGVSWTQQVSGTTAALEAVWAAGPDDVFIVGGNGTVLRKWGGAWVPQAAGTSDYLTGVWGTSGSNVVAVGPGTAYRWDGGGWYSAPLPGGGAWDVGGVAARDVWVSVLWAGRVLRGTPAPPAVMASSAPFGTAMPTASSPRARPAPREF